MNRLLLKAELLANVAIIVLALLLGAALFKNYRAGAGPRLYKGGAEASAERRSLREVAGRLNLDWQKNGTTLLLVLSTTCHFCTESAPFYRRLEKERGDVRLVAVTPQPPVEARDYLQRLAIRVDGVSQSPLGSVGVMGTPTLMLIDGSGLVTDEWVGKLTAEQEDEVLGQLWAR